MQNNINNQYSDDSAHEKYMRIALEEAAAAAAEGEVPVGAVIVRNNEVIARAHNKRESLKNALCHAEIAAINEACRLLGGWRLIGCTLYVTLEPCPMCAGAIVNARVPEIVFGAKDAKAGSFGSVINLNSYPLNHKPEIITGILEKECSEILSSFFQRRRTFKNKTI